MHERKKEGKNERLKQRKKETKYEAKNKRKKEWMAILAHS
jgi:hypothetical protein